MSGPDQPPVTGLSRPGDRPIRRGLVLGGGGVLGAAWMVGALCALEEVAGFDPRTAEVIVGTSAGSVLTALLSVGATPEQLKDRQLGRPVREGVLLAHADFDERAAAGGSLPLWPRLGIGSRELLLNAVRDAVLDRRRRPPIAIASALLPHGRGSLAEIGAGIERLVPAGAWAPREGAWIVALDYDSGERVVFGRDGAPPAGLSEAVMASCAIPGWFASVPIGGRRYVDGGTWSATNADLMAGLGLDEVYVLAPMVSRQIDRPRSMAARLERRLRRLMSRQLIQEARLIRQGGARVALLGPGPEDLAVIGVNLMNSSRRAQVVATSVRTSAAELRRCGVGEWPAEPPDLASTG